MATKVKRPTTLLIGNVEWRVLYLNGAEWTAAHYADGGDNFDENARGETQWSTGVIAIVTDTTEDLIRDVLIHEIMHAVWGCCGLNAVNDKGQLPDGGFDSEEFIQTLQSPALLSAMRQNTAAFDYLMGR